MEIEEKTELLAYSISLKANIELLIRLLPIQEGSAPRKEFSTILEVFMNSVHEYSDSKQGRTSLIMASVALVSLENVLFQSYENEVISKKSYRTVRDKVHVVSAYLQTILALQSQCNF